MSDEFDPITKPEHYVSGRKYEPIDVIADWGLDYDLGCAVKYIARFGRKGDQIEDLKKAIAYLRHKLCAMLKEDVVHGTLNGKQIHTREGTS